MPNQKTGTLRRFRTGDPLVNVNHPMNVCRCEEAHSAAGWIPIVVPRGLLSDADAAEVWTGRHSVRTLSRNGRTLSEVPGMKMMGRERAASAGHFRYGRLNGGAAV